MGDVIVREAKVDDKKRILEIQDICFGPPFPPEGKMTSEDLDIVKVWVSLEAWRNIVKVL